MQTDSCSSEHDSIRLKQSLSADCGLVQAETKEIVRERIDLEEAQARAAQAAPRHDEGDINTDDEEDEQGQMRDFEAWRLRELGRIARSAEILLAF